ncbi:MAG TPA: hypothetical protein ENF87_01955 [Thermoproteales archaeon]|nr:hypothetical protein [Thermoproteales archaeon]
MILIVSTCRYRLSEREFVEPIIEIVKENGYKYHVKRSHEKLNLENYSGIIICGTALMDFDYLKHLKNFKELKNYSGKVLGICAGYQLLAKIYDNQLEKIEKIGVYSVKVVQENPLASGEFRAYFLHVLALSRTRNLEILAKQGNEIAMFKVPGKNFYATSFHPEVFNKTVIENFLNIV